MGEQIEPWTKGPCDECGCEFQITRTEGRERRDRELCEGCESYERGHADGARSASQSETHPVDALFHRLWTKAVGTAGYVKDEWRELNRSIVALCYPKPAEVDPGQAWGAGVVLAARVLEAEQEVRRLRVALEAAEADVAERRAMLEQHEQAMKDYRDQVRRSKGRPIRRKP